MIYPLTILGSISGEHISVLKKTGIVNTDQLLAKAYLPDLRTKLSKKTGIQVDLIMKWASISDFLRIKGVGPKLANILVEKGGIKNLQDFVNKIQGDNDTNKYLLIKTGNYDKEINENLKKFIDSIKENNTKEKIILSHYQVREAFYESLEIQPRLLVPNMDSVNFSQILKEEVKTTFYATVKSASYIFSFLVILAFILIIFIQPSIRNNYINLDLLVEPYYNLDFSFTSLFIQQFNIEASLFVATILSFVYVFLLLFAFASALLSFTLKKILFSNPGIQRSYISYNFQGYIQDIRNKFKLIFLATAILLLVVLIVFLFNISDFNLDILRAPIIIMGNILVVLLFIPYLKTIYKKRPEKSSDLLVLKRLFVINVIFIVFMGLTFLIFVQRVLPATFSTYKTLSKLHSMPSFHNKVDAAINQLHEQDLTIENDELISYNLVGLVKHHQLIFESNFHSSFEELKVSKIHPTYISDLFEILFWIILPVIILVLYFPYFRLNSPFRGAMILTVIVLSILMERFLSSNIAVWFGVNFNMAKSSILVWTIVLGNVIIFDWIASLVSEKKKLCANCQSIINDYHIYCHECGYVQH